MDGTYIDQVEYRIFKRGRTWLHAETRSGSPARIEIGELTAGFVPGETYTFKAKVKAFDFEVRATGQRVRRNDVFALPADYQPNKTERRATIRYCTGAIEEGARIGYLNRGAVKRGAGAGPADFPELQAAFDAAILAASNSAYTVDATDAIAALEVATNDQEREEARRIFWLALVQIENQGGPLAEWLKARYTRANHAATYPKFEQLTLFAA